MKKTSKKIAGGLMVFMLIATIGAVVASANPGFLADLTDDQRQGIRDTVSSMREEGATRVEIRETIREELEGYGVELPTREEMIDQRIEHTQQRLDILDRTKELVEENPDITQEEIREIIQKEFELELPDGEGFGMMNRHGFKRGGCGGPRGFMSDEETE